MNDKSPLISIIVPNYNHAPYLWDRLQSIKKQTVQAPYELILLDDCSTDGSLPILQDFASHHPHCTLYTSPTNSGSPFKQWHKGILQARGEWIWIAESDDSSVPTFLSTCLTTLQQTDAVACVTGSRFIDARGIPMPQRANYWEKGGKPRTTSHTFDGPFYATHRMYWSCAIMNTSAAVFSRRAALCCDWSQIIQMRYAGDWLFWFQMCMQGKLTEVYQDLNLFRRHGSNTTEKGRSHIHSIIEDIDVVSYMERHLPALPAYKRQLRRGLLWRKIKHLRATEAHKETCYNILKERLRGNKGDYMALNLNRYIRYIWPWLLTMERDKKKY